MSKRILKITLNVSPANLFTLVLKNVMSPSKLPEGKYNQYRFKLFCSDAAEDYISHYTFTDYSKELTLYPDTQLIDLSWYYQQIVSANPLITLSEKNTNVVTIRIGYYADVI
jgi:hypothetical protein